MPFRDKRWLRMMEACNRIQRDVGREIENTAKLRIVARQEEKPVDILSQETNSKVA